MFLLIRTSDSSLVERELLKDIVDEKVDFLGSI